jgi:signal transduction histidine kinase
MGTTRRTPVNAVIVALAAALSVLYAGYFLLVRRVTDVSQLQAFFEMTLFGVAVVVLYGSAWLAIQTDARRRLQHRLLGWGLGGGLLLVTVDVATVSVVSPAPDFEDRLLQLILSGGFGVSTGLVMGVLEIQSLQQERARTRSDLVARRRERERQRLELLNRYLRHEILNKVQIVELNADLLLRRTDDSFPERERLETIARRSDDLGRFVQSIRSILQASDHKPSLEPVDLSAILDEEATKLRRSFEGVTVSIDGDDVAVEADTLLSTVVSNLFENAAEHGADAIRATVETRAETVRLRVADDGPGIPPETRSSLFDPPESGDHGYGLFLARNLVELYGGQLVLEDTSPGGTVFVVTLSRAKTGPNESDAVAPDVT